MADEKEVGGVKEDAVEVEKEELVEGEEEEERGV